MQVARPSLRARPAAIIAAISQAGRHYRAGRALYPLHHGYDAESARVLLSRAARDLQANPPQGINVQEAEHVAEIIRDYAAGSFGA
jgi:hypothetical protein